MKIENRNLAIILLFILIVIGGLVMYKEKDIDKNTNTELDIAPKIKGPDAPYPNYEPTR